MQLGVRFKELLAESNPLAWDSMVGRQTPPPLSLFLSHNRCRNVRQHSLSAWPMGLDRPAPHHRRGDAYGIHYCRFFFGLFFADASSLLCSTGSARDHLAASPPLDTQALHRLRLVPRAHGVLHGEEHPGSRLGGERAHARARTHAATIAYCCCTAVTLFGNFCFGS